MTSTTSYEKLARDALWRYWPKQRPLPNNQATMCTQRLVEQGCKRQVTGYGTCKTISTSMQVFTPYTLHILLSILRIPHKKRYTNITCGNTFIHVPPQVLHTETRLYTSRYEYVLHTETRLYTSRYEYYTRKHVYTRSVTNTTRKHVYTCSVTYATRGKTFIHVPSQTLHHYMILAEIRLNTFRLHFSLQLQTRFGTSKERRASLRGKQVRD